MDQDQFWTLVESAAQAAEHAVAVEDDHDDDDHDDDDDVSEPIAREIVKRLAALDTASVLSFDTHLRRATADLNRWDVWAAAYLINGGCSDDSFMDFRAGIVTLGREWHQRVLANPDALAEHPAVIEAASGGDTDFLFAETVNYVAADAFERITGDDHAYYDAVAEADNGEEENGDVMGEDFDFDDADQMKRRLPRLASMFLDEDS